jgi:hypothetical protein
LLLTEQLATVIALLNNANTPEILQGPDSAVQQDATQLVYRSSLTGHALVSASARDLSTRPSGAK